MAPNTTPAADFTFTATPAGSKGTLYTVTKDGEVWTTRHSKRAYRAIAVGHTDKHGPARWVILGYAGTPELAAKTIRGAHGYYASPMVITLEG